MKLELQVQKYLRSNKTLANLKEELGIEYNVKDTLAILNYSQIDSPKNHPITTECRGLILELDSWDIVCLPFFRFYNYGEVAEVTDSFDFSKSVGLEKIDGTMISFFCYKNLWMMSTRGVIENTSIVGLSNITFQQLYLETLKSYPNFWQNIDKNYTYCFELTSPENRVVTIYHERKLHLLLVRDIATLKEEPVEALKLWSGKLGIPIPGIVRFDTKDELLELASKLATLEEGFVAVDISGYDQEGINFKRVKVKNPSYVAIHHLKDRSGRSLRSLVTLVMDNNVDEFIGYFPEFKVYTDKVQVAYDEYLRNIEADVVNLKGFMEKKDKTPEDRKPFALEALKCTNSAYMFQLYLDKVKSISEFFAQTEKAKGRAYLERYLVEKLKLKDIQIYTE
jgi:T4 RnlA family RNA ligase